MTGEKEPEGYFENPVLTKDGEERTVLWHTTVLKGENGDVVGALSSGEDVTERKLAEKALEREHFAFKIIAEAAVNAADVNDLCRRVLTGFVYTLGFDAGTFRLYDESDGVLRLVTSFGLSGKGKEISRVPQPVDDPCSVTAFVARSRQPIITPDVSKEKVLKPFKSQFDKFNEHSLISWPVLGAGGDVLGVLQLWSRKQVDISEGDRAFFERMARIFASVLERTQTEEALRESEERIRQFAEAVPDILYKFNQRECRYDFLSPAFERMTGYTLSEIHADPCDFQLKLVHPDDVIRIMKTINEYAAGGPKDEPLVTETRLIKADGEIVWVRDSILYEWDEEGLSSVIGVMSDITERKRSEEALRESEERFWRFTNTVTDMIYRFDVGRRKYDFISPSCETITGYTADEFNADPTNLWESLIHPEDVERVKKEIDEQLAGERPLNFYSFEYRIVRKDGEVIWVNEQGNFEVDGKGTITNFNGVVRNITERRRADEEIRQLTQFLDLVIDDANVWLNVVDNDGNVLVWNKAAEEITGYSRDEVIGGADIWSELFPDEGYRRKFIEKFNKTVLESEDTTDYDITVRTRNGEVKVISWSTRSLSDKKGQYLGTVALGFDITGRKRAEEEFIKASKMESLSLLAGGIAHDFRNLLSVILGNISYVKSATRLEDEQFVEALSDAEDASYQAKDLTDRLLTFSKGGVPIKETLDVGKLVEESATFAVHGSNVRTVFNIPDDLWVIEADNSQIRQVVNNIVINAVQAMPKGGDVNIRCENTLVKAGRSKKIGLPEGKYVKITLKDSGTGISKENESKIFDPFFTTKYEGTGLGLSTSYSIIKNHNGLITVDSKLGSGSTFEVYLPALEGEPEFRETYNEEFYQGKGKILVMDDEKGVRDLLNKVFTRAGYEVVCAEDGTKALKTYKKAASSGEPFDLVILDLTVPAGMGGKETVRELIRFDPDVKAIVASGYSNDPVLSNFEQYGFRGSVKKPFSISVLTRTVRDVIQGV
jgi:two-component system cell cycle sensor histidine kinase/response regulator CckA